MKANELQIGDWVANPLGWRAKVQSIKYLNDNYRIRIGLNDDSYQDYLSSEEIFPIPLTAEILEKNFPDPTDGLTWFPEEGGFNCHTYVPKCEINAFGLFKYVHQLQNALRLCGIEKGIEL